MVAMQIWDHQLSDSVNDLLKAATLALINQGFSPHQAAIQAATIAMGPIIEITCACLQVRPPGDTESVKELIRKLITTIHDHCK